MTGGPQRRRRRAPHRWCPSRGASASARRAGVAAVDHHRVSASPSAASTACLPAGVDLDEVEQRAEHAVDTGQPLGAGAGVGGVERQLQAPRPGRAATRGRSAASWRCGVTRSNAGLGRDARSCSALLELVDQRALRPPRPARSRRASARTRLASWSSRSRSSSTRVVDARRSSLSLRSTPVRIERSSPRTSAAALAALAPPSSVPTAPRVNAARSSRERLLVGGRARSASGATRPSARSPRRARRGTWPRRPRGWRRRRRRAAGRGRVRASACARRACRPGRGPLAELLDAHQPIADVVGAARRQLGLERHDLGVEPGERRLQLALGLRTASTAVDLDRLELAAQRRDLAAGDEHPQRRRARRRAPRGGGRPRPGVRAGAAGGGPRAAGPGAAAGWPRWRRGGARPSPCACGT